MPHSIDETEDPSQGGLLMCAPKRGDINVLGAWNKLPSEEQDRLSANFFQQLLKPGSGYATMDFFTFGMFIIDEIHFPPPQPSVYGIIGGAGAYAAIGARIFRSDYPQVIGWIVHKGFDFPKDLEEQINSWNTDCIFRQTPNRPTTRAWNRYGKNEKRDFKYLTPKLRIDHTQLNPVHLKAKCYHLICAPDRCIELVQGVLLERNMLLKRAETGEHRDLTKEIKPLSPPIFVWEPIPDSCIPGQLPNVFKALKWVDVISPNHEELANLFGETDGDPFLAGELQVLERRCNQLLTEGFGKKPSAVVVRRGERGCYVASDIRHSWLPAYHKPYQELSSREQASWTQKVVDPTGGGNAFLGGFCIGILQPRPEGRTEFELGAIYGSIAASFIIEQVGMPTLSLTDDGSELWNGESVAERWDAYCKDIELGYLSEDRQREGSFYHPVSANIFSKKVTKMIRIPVDFEGNQYLPKK